MSPFTSASSSRGARRSRPTPWLCALLLLGLGVGCGPSEEGEPSNEPSTLETRQSPVEMPPADTQCREWSRQYTTTQPFDKTLATYTGYMTNGQCVSCSDYNKCVRTTTWLESYQCMGPRVEDGVLMTVKLSSSESCDPTVYNNCPVPFFREPC